MIEIPSIETARLRLVPMSIEFLRLSIDGKFDAAQAVGGFVAAHDCLRDAKPTLARRLQMIEENPEQHPWMVRAIVRKTDNRMVGSINFHHKPPDPWLLQYSALAAELGYTINLDFRRRGYARESAIAMMDWAHRKSGVRTFILSISPRNLPSLLMAESMGFRKIGEQMDEVDGLEYTMKGAIEEILQTHKLHQID